MSVTFIKSCSLNYSVNNIIIYYSGFVFSFFLEIGSNFLAQADPRVLILLPQCLEC